LSLIVCAVVVGTSFATEGPVTLQIELSPESQAPVLRHVLSATGNAGNVLLDSSKDLINWNTITFVSPNGQVEQGHDVTANAAKQFFRLRMDDSFATDPLLMGMTRYTGEWPAQVDVTYTARDSHSYTAQGALAGMVYLLVDNEAEESTMMAAITAANGTVVGATPAAGEYLISTTPGMEATFLTALYGQPWVVDGAPLTPAVNGSAPGVYTTIGVLDWNDSAGNVCSRHMKDVAYLAGRRRPFDGRDRNDPVQIDVLDRTLQLPAEIVLQMNEALKNRQRLIVNLSLQSPTSGYAVSKDRSGSVEDKDKDIRREQLLFYKRFLNMLKLARTRNPEVVDNTLIVIIAGNAGVDLDTELANLKNQYGDEFGHVVIVGGTDASGQILKKYNHLTDNTGRNMAYARGEDVFATPCSGTSYAGPEITSVVDAIWRTNPNFSSDKIIEAFYQVLHTLGTGNVVPMDGNGLVTNAFINLATEYLATLPQPEPRVVEVWEGTAVYHDVDTWPNSPGWTPDPYSVTGSATYAVTLNATASLLVPNAAYSATLVEEAHDILQIFPAEANSELDLTVPESQYTSFVPRWNSEVTGTGGWNPTVIITDLPEETNVITATISIQSGTGVHVLRVHYEGSTIYSVNESASTTVDYTLMRR
jgi:hypothetical protein